MVKYEEITVFLKDQISKGIIKPGEKLPSIRNISEQFKCSKITAAKVYDLLEREHIIYSVPKSGHFLIENKLNTDRVNLNTTIDFSSAAPDSSALPYEEFQHCLNQAISLYKESLFSHNNIQGLENLLEVIIKQLQNYQVFVDRQSVFITTGSQQAINILTMMKFPNGKENVLIEQPTYHGVIKSLELNKIKVIGISRFHKGIDFNELENIFKHDNIKFFYTIPRFHNPTGFSYSSRDKKRILELCEKYNVYIVEDDYLADLEVDKKSDPIYALDVSSRVIYLKSFSKILLPGLRVSAVILPNALIETFKEYKRWNDLNTPILSQGALEIYIKSGMFNVHTKKLRKVYSDRMNYLDKITKSFTNTNINWYIPKSGFFACFEINNKMNTKDIFKRILEKKVLLKDSSIFALKHNVNNNIIRLSVSRSSNNEIKKGVSIILNEINN